MTSIGSFNVASVAGVAAAGSGAPVTPATLARSAVLGTVDRVLALIVREGGFGREDAGDMWSQIATVASGAAHAYAEPAAGKGADVYGLDAFAGELAGAAGDASPSGHGQMLRAVQAFMRPVALQLHLGKRDTAARAFEPIAFAVLDAMKIATGSGSGSGASAGDVARGVEQTLAAAAKSLEARIV